jgi:hypothetical protein
MSIIEGCKTRRSEGRDGFVGGVREAGDTGGVGGEGEVEKAGGAVRVSDEEIVK